MPSIFGCLRSQRCNRRQNFADAAVKAFARLNPPVASAEVLSRIGKYVVGPLRRFALECEGGEHRILASLLLFGMGDQAASQVLKQEISDRGDYMLAAARALG